jgi:dTDP-4-dehydrorhamnose reductase
MTIVVVGRNGMLGSDVCSVLSEHFSVTSFNSSELDITSPSSIKVALDSLKSIPFLINCAAYTQVDNCESERNLAFRVNGEGPANLARYCVSRSIPLIHFSTDYVFDGEKETPYLEDDDTNPINVYGESKLEGEKQIQALMTDYYIFRVQWLYGTNGKHFIKTISKLASERSELSIVDDQWGSPTWTVDIARAVLSFVKNTPTFGTYHFSNSGYCNWYEFAQEIVSLSNSTCKINPQPSSAYPVPATRPNNSRLDRNKYLSTGAPNARPWQEACKQFILGQ